MARDQFTFYRSFYEAIKCLKKNSDRLSAYEAITAYALDGVEVPRTDSADAIFILIKPLLDSAARKSKGGKISASNAQDASKISASTEQDADNNIKNKKKNYIKNKCYIVNAPPRVEEVKAYCEERNNGVDAERFVAYYEANGWRVGKNPMKDWKAAVRTWERSEKKPTAPSFSDMWREFDDEA